MTDGLRWVLVYCLASTVGIALLAWAMRRNQETDVDDLEQMWRES